MSKPIPDVSDQEGRAAEAEALVRLTADTTMPVNAEVIHRLARLLQAEIASHDFSHQFP